MRAWLQRLGFRSIAEAVGHVECLDTREAVDHWKASRLDITDPPQPDSPFEQDLHQTQPQDHGLERARHRADPPGARRSTQGTSVEIDLPIRNVHRTVGTLLGHEITKRHRAAGLPDDTVQIRFTGSAGQGFEAFVPKGVTMRLEGDANDYLGKGLSGGRLIVRPPADSHPDFVAEDNIVAGNVILYGATGGEVYLRGVVGERFCVRNSRPPPWSRAWATTAAST